MSFPQGGGVGLPHHELSRTHSLASPCGPMSPLADAADLLYHRLGRTQEGQVVGAGLELPAHTDVIQSYLFYMLIRMLSTMLYNSIAHNMLYDQISTMSNNSKAK